MLSDGLEILWFKCWIILLFWDFKFGMSIAIVILMFVVKVWSWFVSVGKYLIG